ncbi:MAG: hypothetical protein IJA61_03960 [Clostridia bacterium]|nr:hypothetical protein [Clostridia bacterium]
MNIVWTITLIASLIVMLVIDPANAFSEMLNGSEQAINLSIKLWAVYALWLGILQIIEDTKLDEVFKKLLNPIISILFKDVDEYTKNQIAINITSNLLGMGNACTPSGINAIGGMYKGGNSITGNMSMLIVFNTANIQLIPTTIIGIRILHGSANSSSIIFPTILTSIASVTLGIFLSKICAKIFLKEKKHE